MRALVCLLIMLFLMPLAIAQDSPSPAVAQRILRIIERSGDDAQQMLDDLDRLANARGIRDSDRGFIRREQAALLIREERNAEATELLTAALENRPPDYMPSLRLFLGQLLLMDNQPEPAIEQLRHWSSNVVNPRPSELSILGYAYLQLEQFSAAIDLFERVIASAEIINDQWYEVLAYAYVQDGQSDTAIELLDRVIAEQPAESRWWRQLSNLFTLMENYGTGAAALAIADTLDNLSYDNGRRLAGLFSMLNMPAEGALALQAASQRYPDERNYEDEMMLAELWTLARETDQAISVYEQARALANDGEPSLRIAQLHLQWERYDLARAALHAAASGYGESTPDEVWYLLAIVEINRDQPGAASDALQRIDPEGAYGDRVANLNQFIENRLAASAP